MKQELYLIITLLVLLVTCKNKKASEEQTQTPLCRALASVSGIDALPTPKFRTDIGNSTLTISTKSADAQKWFNQGLNHLHAFWHLEAYRAFLEVIKQDPNCAMGYWGLAMCQPGFGGTDSRWANWIDKAASLKTNSTALEQDLITTCQSLIKSGPDGAFQGFQNLTKKYPDEPEVVAFAAIMMRQSNNDMSGVVGNQIKYLLEQTMKKYPTNTALMHYYIHLLELRSDFKQANPIAQKMVQLASKSPHLSHMPGHLYYLSGHYEKAAYAYELALKQETAYHQAEKIPFSANQNYIHNLHFLAVTYSELGQKEKALTIAKKLSMLHISSDIPNEGAVQMLLYEGRILPALVHIRFREWNKAQAEINYWLNTSDAPIQNNMVKLYLQVMEHYCMSMSATESGNIDLAVQLGGELSRLLQTFEQQGVAYQNTPDFKSINETYDIMNMARFELAGWIDNIDSNKPFNDTAWKEAINLQNAIRYDEPPRLMYPIEESMGRLFLKRKEMAKAKQAFSQALKRRPQSQIISKL